MKIKLAPQIIFISTVMASASADAATVFGNLGADGTNAIRSSGLAVSNGTVNPRNLTFFNLAQGFTVGPSLTGWTLNSVKIGLLGTANVKLSLFSNNSGEPGTEIASQTLSINTTSTTPFPGTTFTFTPVALSAGVNYWLVASKVSSETNWFTWTLSDAYSAGDPSAAALTGQNTSGWLYTDSLYQPAGGGAWADAAVVTGNAQYASLTIDASPVPEPSTWALAVFAGAAACYGLRRCK